jgi:hypothetical protein
MSEDVKSHVRKPCPHCKRLHKLTEYLNDVWDAVPLADQTERGAVHCPCGAVIMPAYLLGSTGPGSWRWKLICWII